MNYRLPLVLVFTILIIPITSFAQASDLIPLDDRNHYGQFSIDNVHVSEKEYYKVIFIDVHVKVKDLALEDSSEVFWDGITLTNENGKKYQAIKNVGSDCNPKQWDGTFYVMQGVSGKEGGIGQHSLCYMVEKEFYNFKVYYNIPYYTIPNSDMHSPSFQIGNIVLNQSNDPTFNGVSNPSTSNPSTSSTSQSATNIFTQFFDWLKSLFHFS
jgi:hypothetical protein